MLGSGLGKVATVAFSDDAMEVSDDVAAIAGKDEKPVVVYLPNCKEDQVINEGLLHSISHLLVISISPSQCHSSPTYSLTKSPFFLSQAQSFPMCLALEILDFSLSLFIHR